MATDCNDYILTHGLGEVPLFFMVGMGASPNSNKSFSLLGAWGFGDREIGFRLSKNGEDAPSGVFREVNLYNGTNVSLHKVSVDTIAIAPRVGTVKLAAGIPYYWVALSEESFS